MAQAPTPAEDLLGTAATWQPAELVARWIGLGANVNATAPQYARTPLMNAVSSELEGAETLKLLLDRGADPNARTTEGETALDWAIYKGDRAKIAMLEARGAIRGNGPRREEIAPPAKGGIADPRISAEQEHRPSARCRSVVSRENVLHFLPPQHAAGDGRGDRQKEGN